MHGALQYVRDQLLRVGVSRHRTMKMSSTPFIRVVHGLPTTTSNRLPSLSSICEAVIHFRSTTAHENSSIAASGTWPAGVQ